MAKSKSRSARWNDATGEARSALDSINDIMAMPDEERDETTKPEVDRHLESLTEAVANLLDLQQEYSDWLDNMPEGLQQSATADKLQAIVDLSLEPDIPTEWDDDMDLSDAESCLDEAESADLPLGFGRD